MDNNYMEKLEQRINALERRTKISTVISIITVAILIYSTGINYFSKLKIIHSIGDVTIGTLKLSSGEIEAVQFSLYGQITNLSSVSVDIMEHSLDIEFDGEYKGKALMLNTNSSDQLEYTFVINSNQSKSFRQEYFIKIDESNSEYFKELKSKKDDIKIKYIGNFEVDRGFKIFDFNFFGSNKFSEEKSIKIKTYS